MMQTAGFWLFFVMIVTGAQLVRSSSFDTADTDKTPRDSFKWTINCVYKGDDIEVINGITSLMRCAEACFENNLCNFFIFGASSPTTSICLLKHVFDISRTVSAQSNICGMIEKRIPKLLTIRQQIQSIPSGRIVSASEISALFNRQFQISADGTYAFSGDNCNFPGENTKTYNGGDLNGTSIDYCARACEDQQDICDHFVFSTDGTQATCFLKKNPTGEVYVGSYPSFICGVMTNLLRSSPTTILNFNNVEFMPSKCNYELISTTTIKPDSLSPNDSY